MRRCVPFLLLLACGMPATAPTAPTHAPVALDARPPAPASPDPLVTLAAAPGTSLAGVWLRRLAAAWQATHDAKSPEVAVAAEALRATARWLTIDEELELVAKLLPLAPVFEENTFPVGRRLAQLHGGAREARGEEDARLLPGRLAIYSRLGPRGRRRMVFLFDDATLDAFMAVKDGVCPAVLDDRELRSKHGSPPSMSRCLPPPLPADELGDVDRLSAELAGPWPRAVRAIEALRAYANHHRPMPFRPTLAQQKHFVEGCVLHPMCPLFLLDEVDPGLEPALREAEAHATAEQAEYLDTALRQIAGERNARAPNFAKIDAAAPACVARIQEALAGTTGEPWMREARAQVLRDRCFIVTEELSTATLKTMLPAADTVTAGVILGALALRPVGTLPVADVARVAADIRTRDDLFAKLEDGKRRREMPAAWATEKALVDAEAYAWIAHAYGAVPDAFEDEATKVTVLGKPARFVYVRVSAKDEYASVPPLTIAVGPLAGPARARHDGTGTDWGTHEEGIRAYVEANLERGDLLALFVAFQ